MVLNGLSNSLLHEQTNYIVIYSFRVRDSVVSLYTESHKYSCDRYLFTIRNLQLDILQGALKLRKCLTFAIYQWLVPIVPLFIAHKSIVAQYERINKRYITQALRKFSNEILERKNVARYQRHSPLSL